MEYPNIQKATFINRPNRFIATVDINGHKETVHVKNTGRCKELLIPGCEVWLTAPGTPDRKTTYDLVAVKKDTGVLYNIDSQAPNKVVKEWLQLKDYDKVVPEYTYGQSRIDFYMEKGPDRYLMEVKGCTLEKDGIGYFPDAPTKRGAKHLIELTEAVKKGYKAAVAFVIQMDGVSEVRPNIETDPQFSQAFEKAKAAGVKVLFLKCHVTPNTLLITGT